jgi:hypothetical protein
VRDHYGAATEEPWRAVTSARPRRPLRAWPRRLKRRTRSAKLWTRLWALNGLVPYQVRTTLEWPELQARNLTLEGCEYRPVVSQPAQHERAPQVPSIYEKLLISGSRAGPTANPRNLQMSKVGGNQLPPRNGPTDHGFET